MSVLGKLADVLNSLNQKLGSAVFSSLPPTAQQASQQLASGQSVSNVQQTFLSGLLNVIKSALGSSRGTPATAPPIIPTLMGMPAPGWAPPPPPALMGQSILSPRTRGTPPTGPLGIHTGIMGGRQSYGYRIARRLGKKIGRIGGGAITTGQSVAHMAGGAGEGGEHTTQRIFQGLSGIASLFGPYGKAAGAVLSFAGGVSGAADGMRKWVDSLYDANVRLADFGGEMSAVRAESEARRIQLSQEQGDARAESARRLAEARDRANRAWAPFENRWANFTNELGAGAAQVSGFVGTLLNASWEVAGRRIFQTLFPNTFRPNEEPAGGVMGPLHEATVTDGWMINMAQSNWSAFYGRPLITPENNFTTPAQ